MQLWDIESALPYSVQGRFLRDKDGHEVWVACVKVGWQRVAGEWCELDTHPAVNDSPVYVGEDGASVMSQDHDFVISKRNTDVIVQGKARALGKNPVNEMQCRLLLDGHVDKTLRVLGPRKWFTQAGQLGICAPAKCIEAEIDYSHAMGGFDERNRVGCGVGETQRELLTQAVPSVFYPGQNWNLNFNKVKPAGFGPLPPYVTERSQLAGTFDQHWIDNRRPLYPKDFDPGFYQCAPLDQQCVGLLQGGERLVLSGFDHEGAMLFFLPKLHFTAQAHLSDKIITEAMALHTLFIDTEVQQITGCWQAAFPCQGQEHLLQKTVISQAKVAKEQVL